VPAPRWLSTGACSRREARAWPRMTLHLGVDGRELQGRPTGTGRYLRNLLREWRDRDARIVIFFNGRIPDDPVLNGSGFETRAVGPGRRGVVWQEWLLPRAARTEKLDVFFSPAYACPLSFDVPRVTTVHDLSFWSLPQDFSPREAFRRRLLVGASIAASAAIIAVSEFTRREIAAWHPDAACRVHVIPHGLDDDLQQGPARSAARAQLGIEAPLLLSVGAILNRRRLPTLLGALTLLRRVHPGTRLYVVGENRTHPQIDFTAMLRARGLEDAVHLLGFVDEERLAAYYAAADIAVSLSEYEGFGLPVLEAMARGVPVVASRRPAHDELFGRAALLADPSDESEIANVLSHLLDETHAREACIESGHALCNDYSWKRAADAHWRVLEAATT